MRPLTAVVIFTLLTIAAFAGPLQTVVLDVSNMTCQLCPITVRKALEKVPGVAEVKVDFARKTATVAFDPAKAATSALLRASTDAGYPATLHACAEPAATPDCPAPPPAGRRVPM